MTRRVALHHQTTYRYDRAVYLGPQWVRLRPIADPRIQLPQYELKIDPAPITLNWLLDPLGNPVARVALPGPIDRLCIAVVLQLDLAPRNPFDFVLDAAAVRWPFVYADPDADALAIFTKPLLPGPLLQAMRGTAAAERDTVELVLTLGAQVCRRVDYIIRIEPGVWTPEQTLREGRGSCRDSAWLLVQLLRLHGIAARFVSGYLVQLDEPGADPPGNAELHAWADAYLPGAGWVGIDATSGLLTAEGHIALAAAPTPAGAAPLQGTVEPVETWLEASITLRDLGNSPHDG